MEIESEVSSSILRFYQAAGNDGDWSDALGHLNKLFNAAGATVHQIEHGPPVAVSYWGAGIDASLERLYQHEFVRHDVRVAASMALTEGQVVSDLDLVQPHLVKSHPFYNEFLFPNGYGYFLCAIAVRRAHLTVGVSLQLARADGEPTSRQVRMLRLMAPHIRQAMLIRNQVSAVQGRESAFQGALDQLQSPIVIVDAGLRLLWANRSGEELLRVGDLLRCCGGLVYTPIAEDHAVLARSVNDVCISRFRENVRLEIPVRGLREGRPTRVLIAMAPDRHMLDRSRHYAVIIVCDPEVPAPIPQLIAKIFGLTVAEAKLVDHLASGGTVEQFCYVNSVTSNTARTHLKRIFEKMGVSRQSDLVALVCRYVGMIG